MRDYSNQIIIYDKYKGDYDLYESNDIGSKHIYPCTKVYSSTFTKYGFETDNLLLKLVITPNLFDVDEDTNQATINYIQEIKKEFNDNELKKYIQMANQNPSCLYIVEKVYELNPIVYNNYNSGVRKTSSIFTVCESNSLARIQDEKEKATFLEEVESIFQYNTYLYDYSGQPEYEEKNYFVNMDTFEKFEDYKELFSDLDSIQELIRNKVQNAINKRYIFDGTEDLEQVLNDATIDFTGYVLRIRYKNKIAFDTIDMDYLVNNFKYWSK